MQEKKRRIKKGIFILLGIVMVGIIAFVSYTSYMVANSYEAMHSLEAYEIMYPDLTFEMIDRDTLKILPIDYTKKDPIGIIFYPGAMVDYQAYVPLMASISRKGYICYLEKMPFNMAILHTDQADETIQGEKEIRHWFLSGHSMGGMSAMNYAKNHGELLEGLISYAASTYVDLKEAKFPFLTMYGDRDSVVGDSYEKYKKNNPKKTKEYLIKGANHAQFGDYGSQDGDSDAKITPKEQWEKAALITDRWIKENK